jgi:hypothetical protein
MGMPWPRCSPRGRLLHAPNLDGDSAYALLDVAERVALGVGQQGRRHLAPVAVDTEHPVDDMQDIIRNGTHVMQ